MANQILVYGGRTNGPAPSPAAVDLGQYGATVTNLGTVTMYYRDETFSATSSADGSLAPAESTTLYGQQYFLLGSADPQPRAMLAISLLAATAGSSGGGSGYLGDFDSLEVGTAVSALQIVSHEGSLWARTADGTIGGSFNPGNWTDLLATIEALIQSNAESISALETAHANQTYVINYGSGSVPDRPAAASSYAWVTWKGVADPTAKMSEGDERIATGT